MSDGYTRREVVKIIGAAAALGGLAGSAPGQSPSASTPQRRRALRLAHLTDVHIEPEHKADAGLAACLRHVQSLNDRPQLVLTGGDAVYDSFEAEDARTELQWGLWRKVFKDECSLPVEHCIGNHDIWGGNKGRSRTTGQEPNYGKKRAMDNYGIAERYRSFDHPASGWHFIVLDSTQPEGDGYRAFLDPPQVEWLQQDLSAVNPKTPVLVLSHIPIIAASALLWAARSKQGEYVVSDSMIHQDAVKIKELFAQHRNVKLCLSGHLHHTDRVDYNGVTYLCNGAVSGNWWKGRHKDTGEGYGIIDLYNDGTFEHQYNSYGWKAAP